MRTLAVFSALACFSSGVFLLTSFFLAPGLGDNLLLPMAGLMLLALVVPLFVGASAIGRNEVLTQRVEELEQKIRMVAAQVPPPGIHTSLPGMPNLGELVGNRVVQQETPVA